MASPRASAASFSFIASSIISLLLLSFFDFLDFLPEGDAPPRNGTSGNDDGILFEDTNSSDHMANASSSDCVDRFILVISQDWCRIHTNKINQSISR